MANNIPVNEIVLMFNERIDLLPGPLLFEKEVQILSSFCCEPEIVYLPIGDIVFVSRSPGKPELLLDVIVERFDVETFFVAPEFHGWATLKAHRMM